MSQAEPQGQLEVTRQPLKAGFVGLLRAGIGMPEAFWRQLAHLISCERKQNPRQMKSSALDKYNFRVTLQTGFQCCLLSTAHYCSVESPWDGKIWGTDTLHLLVAPDKDHRLNRSGAELLNLEMQKLFLVHIFYYFCDAPKITSLWSMFFLWKKLNHIYKGFPSSSMSLLQIICCRR